jgi:hypothetical protein
MILVVGYVWSGKAMLVDLGHLRTGLKLLSGQDFGHVGLCLIMFGYVWLCLVMFGCVWFCLVMFG